MEPVHESIFSSAIRSFCKAFAGMIGVFFSFLPIIFLFASLIPSGQVEVSKAEVAFLPDLNGSAKMQGPTTPVVLQLSIEGTIGDEEGVLAKEIERQLIESRKGMFSGDRVKAILLSVNTPGGTVFDSDRIYRLIKEYKKTHNVPVYAYVDGLCASGGMYISCSADQIYSSSSSIIGSVGIVFGPFFNFSQLLKNWNIGSKTLTEGTDKDTFNPLRPWKESEGEMFESIMAYYYNTFVDLVVENRPNIDKKELVEEYGAKIFDAPTAKKLGYIDQDAMSYKDALKALLEAAEIDVKKPYQVAEIKQKKQWLSEFLSNASSSCVQGIFSKKREGIGIEYKLAP